MASSVLAYKDAVVCPFPNPDDPRLMKVHKKGFAEEVRTASDEELKEWQGLYPAWYMRRFRRLSVLWCSKEGKVRVVVPKSRAHDSGYYSWIAHLPLPEGGYWYLLTLTLYREVGFERSWWSVNRWTSRFLNRFRTYLKTKYGVSPSYIWVVEVHKDGFPHVHVLFRMPYIHELNFRVLLSMFQSYWVDDEGRALCAPQGVDLKYIGRNVRQVREYVLKYLVKEHDKYWRVELLPNGMTAYRRSSACMWLFRVRLFGMSQDIRRLLKEREERRVREGSSCVFYGTVSANRVHKLYYLPLGIPYEAWIARLPRVRRLVFSGSCLPELVPSAFNSRGSPYDGSIDDLVECF